MSSFRSNIKPFFQGSDDGQYMVEFSLAFLIFVMFIFVVVDLGFLIYNHNLFYNAVYRGARQASLGASNDEIVDTVESIAVEQYYPGVFMMARPNEGIEIEPSDEMDRVQGRSVTVRLDTTFGISLGGLVPLTATFPISSESLIHVNNDRDRDGRKDSEEGNPRDHDNDGSNDQYFFQGPDSDADGDGAAVGSDTVTIGYFDEAPTTGFGDYSGYAIHRPNNAATCSTFEWPPSPAPDSRTWETPPCFDGDYHAPEIWDNGRESPLRLFSRELPFRQVDNNPARLTFTRTLRTDHDRDNDGWIDKYDDAPGDPTEH